MGASRLWWKRFVEQVSFEPGMTEFIFLDVWKSGTVNLLNCHYIALGGIEMHGPTSCPIIQRW